MKVLLFAVSQNKKDLFEVRRIFFGADCKWYYGETGEKDCLKFVQR